MPIREIRIMAFF